jgi:hypothetical protein
VSFKMPKASHSPPNTRYDPHQHASRANAESSRSLSRTDIVMSIKPEHINNIVSRVKNHEYRNYLLPSTVGCIWLYTSAPAQEIRYVAAIGPGKRPGEVEEDGGLGNEDFNAGRNALKFGYKILELRELQQPLSLSILKSSGYLKGPPQKYCWAPQSMIAENNLDEQKLLFTEAPLFSATAAPSSPPPGRPNQRQDIRKFFT